MRWQLAHAGLRAMLSPCARASSSASPRLASSSSGGTTRAAAAAAACRARSRASTCPRRTGDVRCGMRRDRQDAALPEQPATGLVGQRDPPEVTAVHVRDAVVPGQPLVDERVVGRQQVEHAAVLAHDAVEEQLGLRAGARARRLSSKSGNSFEFGLLRLQIPQLQPLAGEVAPRAPATADRRASAAPAARGPPAFFSRPVLGHVQQLVVGNAAPQEERQPRRELEIADAGTRAPGRHRAGSRSTRNRNVGLDEHAPRAPARCPARSAALAAARW